MNMCKLFHESAKIQAMTFAGKFFSPDHPILIHNYAGLPNFPVLKSASHAKNILFSPHVAYIFGSTGSEKKTGLE